MRENVDVLHHLIKKFDVERERLTTVLGQGLAQDHADYRFQCGVIRGLSIAVGMLTDTAERLEDYDE